MKITIDNNNHTVLINPDEEYENSEYEVSFSDLKRGIKIEALLEEIFHRIWNSTSGSPSLGLTLESLNEDDRTVVGEW